MSKRLHCDAPDCPMVWTIQDGRCVPDMEWLSGKDFCCWACLVAFATAEAERWGTDDH